MTTPYPIKTGPTKTIVSDLSQYIMFPTAFPTQKGSTTLRPTTTTSRQPPVKDQVKQIITSSSNTAGFGVVFFLTLLTLMQYISRW